MAERLSVEAGRLRFRIESFERDVAADSLVILRDIRRQTSSREPEAFRHVSVAELDERGFFKATSDGDYLFGPTSAVLLDPWFVDTHCMAVVPPAAGDSLLGVRFGPNSERHQPEIQGTVWLDAGTRELRQVEFEYVSLPGRVTRGSRGVVFFERLADGSLIIRDWTIVSPIVELGEVVVFGDRRPVERVAASRETGGEVLTADIGATAVYRATRATVEGVVFDSVNQLPLAGAKVFVLGSGFVARSDSLGRYRIEYLPEGVYRISFQHARLESFGYRPVPVKISVDRGGSAHAELGIPKSAKLLVSPEEIARLDSTAAVGRYLGITMGYKTPTPKERQRASVERSRPARVIGRVISHLEGTPIPGVAVRLSPVGQTLEAGTTVRTDSNGQFLLPAVMAGEYWILVEMPGYESSESQVAVEQGLEYEWVVRLRAVQGSIPAGSAHGMPPGGSAQEPAGSDFRLHGSSR